MSPLASGVSAGLQRVVRGVLVRGAETAQDGGHRRLEHAAGGREVDPLAHGGRGAARGHDNLLVGGLSGRLDDRRQLHDDGVHEVVGVEVGVEDEVRRVTGEGDEPECRGVDLRVRVVHGLRRAAAGVGESRDRALQLRPGLGGLQFASEALVDVVHRPDGLQDPGARGVEVGREPGGRLHRSRTQEYEVPQERVSGRDVLGADLLLGAERDLILLLSAVLHCDVDGGCDQHHADEAEFPRDGHAVQHRSGRGQHDA
ncbi:hypothetical protein LRS13_19300 [Svornostia abyssi]|uniref:Uncharacterized protein n=1 Tax=Svornostia abyssi TaxID=2898438 RepID=A0ABY5PEG1_9ACTN|nr:hypothetical protein LRS13_19300 [Parviterribacteraceae bacterium J379]